MAGWGTIYNNTSLSLRRQMTELSRMQEQSSSGLEILHASDAPSSAYRIMSLNNSVESLKSYTENLQAVQSDLNQIDSILQSVSASMIRAQQLLEQAASGSYSEVNRQAMAEEIDGILEQVASLANHKYMDKYLFAGGADTEPYSITRENGKIVSVEYQGSMEETKVPVAPGVEYPGLLVGDQFFRNNQRQQPIFLGDTGAQVGKGTSSARGDIWLEVTHSTTTVNAPALGLAMGASSDANDTLIGNGTVEIDEPNRRVRLGTGDWWSMDDVNAADLKLTDENGRYVYVDVTGIAGGTVGTVSITSNGDLSINGGTDKIAIDFSNNQPVTDTTTEPDQILYVNSIGIKDVGVEPVRIPGTYDIFNMLITLRENLENTHNLETPEQLDILAETLGSMQEVQSGVHKQMTTVGARLQALDNLKANMEEISSNSEDEVSSLQDADVIQLAIDITRYQTLYQMTLQTASKLLNLSLLDYVK